MKKILFPLIALALLTPCAWSQQSNLTYISQRLPMSHQANPALFPSRNTAYLSLPGVNVRLNSPLAYSDIIQTSPDDSLSHIDLNHILTTLCEEDFLGMNADVSLLGLGIRVKRLFVTLDASLHADASIGFPSGLATLLQEGNYAHRGDDDALHLLDENLLHASAYTEFGLGAGVQVTDHLTVGARVKLLNGHFNASSANTSVRLYTADDLSSLSADLYYQLRMAGQIAVDDSGNIALPDFTTPDGKVNWNCLFTPNMGVGVDLGARYETPWLDLSASVTDLFSSLSWSQNVVTLSPANGDGYFSFSGIDVSQMIQGGQIDSTFLSTLQDTLVSLVEPTLTHGESYRTHLPAKFNVCGTFKATPWLRVGAIMHGEVARNTPFRTTTSLVAQASILDWIELVGSMSMVYDGNKPNWFNPGVGISLAPFKTLQVYALMDYLSNIYLVDAKSVSVRAGVNLMLVNKPFQWRRK